MRNKIKTMNFEINFCNEIFFHYLDHKILTVKFVIGLTSKNKSSMLITNGSDVKECQLGNLIDIFPMKPIV